MSFEIEIDVPPPADGAGMTGEERARRRVWVKARIPKFLGEVWVQVEQHGGSWECRRVRIDSSLPLTTTLLRLVPLSAIVERAARQMSAQDAEFTHSRLLAAGFTEEELRLAIGSHTGKPRRVGSAGPTHDDLRRFAVLYRIAIWTGSRNPIALTMSMLKDQQGLEISRATANRWREMCQRTDPPLLAPEQDDARRRWQLK